jgi:HlyD family secretion protein
LNDADIYSPIDGIVVRKNIQSGEYVSPGNVVVSVATTDLIVESKVPESDIAKVQVGQTAKITLDAFSDEDIFSAEITEIEPSATVIQDVVYYKIKLKLKDEDERIKPGMSANIDISTAERSGVLTVPARAIKTEGNKKYVEVLQTIDNMTKKVYVETGLEGDEGMVEVKSGLKEGEKVVTFVVAK